MSPAIDVLLPLLFLCHPLLYSAQASKQDTDLSASLFAGCWEIGFPFAFANNPKCWGLSVMNCTEPEPKVQFHQRGKWYPVKYFNYWNRTIKFHGQGVENNLESNNCDSLGNFSEHVSLSMSINVKNTRPFYKSKREPLPLSPPNFFNNFLNYTSCRDHDLYFYDNQEMSLHSLPIALSSRCSIVHLPSSGLQHINVTSPIYNLRLLWKFDFTMKLKTLPDCLVCHHNGNRCVSSGANRSFECINFKESKHGNKRLLKLWIALSTSGCISLLISFIVCWKMGYLSSNAIMFWKRKQQAQQVVEDMLKNNESCAPKRNSYSG